MLQLPLSLVSWDLAAANTSFEILVNSFTSFVFENGTVVFVFVFQFLGIGAEASLKVSQL